MRGWAEKGASGLRRVSWGLVLALVAAGCGGEAPSGEGAGDGPDAGPDAGSTATGVGQASGEARFTGFLTVEGTTLLTLCGTGEELTVDGPAYQDLLDLHAALAPGMERLEGIFVDVLGRRVEGPGEPALEALEVRRAAWEGGGCGDPEPGLAFRASGTEPFWSLTVLEASMVWRTPDGTRTFEHRGPYRSDRGDWLVDGRAPAGPDGTGADPGSPSELTARFYPEPCQDAMSGAWFHMSAEVTLDGREYRGCAYAGEASPP